MEISTTHEVVRRRANVIASHLVVVASHEDISAAATGLYPMTCSNSMNSLARRRDNRMNFARQGTTSQGFFMRQAASTEQGSYYMQHPALKPSCCGDKGSNSLDAPMFSRPAAVAPGIPSVIDKQSVVRGCQYSETPKFAHPNGKYGQLQFQSKERTDNIASKGLEWSPRVDIVESGLSYFISIEIPGVSIDNIKVEVNDQSLIVMGTRSNWSRGVKNCSNNSASSYHKREISQGPYRIVWPLPANANKEKVSAEIQDGILQVTIPKLSGLRWLKKAHM